MLFNEPVPIREGDPQAAFFFNSYLRDLFQKSNYLRFTQRSGAPQHGDKAGNFDGQWIVFTSNGTANTEDTVTHTLGRVPIGILPCVPDKAARLYDSGTTWTRTAVYLKSSAATVAWRAIIF